MRSFAVVQPTGLTPDQDALQQSAGASATLSQVSNEGSASSWARAKEIVDALKPIPWVVWRIGNYVFGQPGKLKSPPEGLVMGLKRILMVAAHDKTLGAPDKKSADLRAALQVLEPGTVAAVSIVHAAARRLLSAPHESAWRPLLDEALNRAQIGAELGKIAKVLGPGRGMLAGFCGSIGFAFAVAGADDDSARQVLEELAEGRTAEDLSTTLFGVHPIHLGATIVASSGCGIDAVAGFASAAKGAASGTVMDQDQARWVAALAIIEGVRAQRLDLIGEDDWELLQIFEDHPRQHLVERTRQIVRRGHTFGWLATTGKP